MNLKQRRNCGRKWIEWTTPPLGIWIHYLLKAQTVYRIAGMLGRVNVWQIAKIKLVGKKL